MTRQRALFKSKRRGDSQRVIDNRLTCQRALCNRGKRQGDDPRVIDNRLTCQRALCNRGKRQGDSPRVIDNRFTCQRALCNRGKRQGDDPRVIATDLVHGSSTTVQNRVQLREKFMRTYDKLLTLMSNYENLLETMKALYAKQMCLYETLVCACEIACDLGNIMSKVDETCTLKTYHNCLKGTTEGFSSQLDSNDYNANIKSELLSTFTIQTKHLTSNQSYAFNRSRSRCIQHLVHAKRRDREPSRIPMKKLVYLMSKNKTRRHRIKSFIRQFIPESSSWHNLLSTRYRKYVIQKPTNTNMWQFRKPTKFAKKECLKITNKHTSRTRKHKLFKLNNAKIVYTNKCNVQRIKTSNKCLLFLCGDIELNPGPVNTSDMSVLMTRLARIGRKPVNIVGDGNCFFRSVSHQLYGTEDRHSQIRAIAIQHLINCPEHFVEYNTDQSWLQYLQNMSTLGTWADHIIIQAVANTNSLRINIMESALNFSESTIVSSIYTQPEGRNARNIYIGHLDELHYVSTTPITQSFSVQTNQTSAKTKSNSRDSQSNVKTFLKKLP